MRRYYILLVVILFIALPANHMLIGEEQLVSRANLTGNFFSTGTDYSISVGRDILNRGGSAVDAVLASALARITLDVGYIVSFAGIYMMVYYEAGTGKIYSLNACFKTPLEENDPLTIRTGGIPNARAVMVPGFMAGVQAAHDRFGKLPWQEIFKPAIKIAEEGFVLPRWWSGHIAQYWYVLGVLSESRNIFLKRKYGLFNGYQPGDLFIQPELAHTLRQVSGEGARYMYTGAWGQKLVDIIQREGGKMILRDLESYEPVWSEPLHARCNGYDVYALGGPSLGGRMVALGINLMESADLSQFDHYSRSADALYRLIYCSRAGELFYPPYSPELLNNYFSDAEFTFDTFWKKENARRIWEKIESGEWGGIEGALIRNGYNRPSHSEGLVAIDHEGNVAAVCHTINCDHWGNSGIFVDGVSVPGAGYFQREWIDKVGPGTYLPDTTNPCLVMRDGQPYLTSSCIGSDLHSATVINLYNMLHFDMTPQESRNYGKFQSIEWSTLKQKVRDGALSQSILNAVEEMGLGIKLVSNWASEYWIGLLVNLMGE